MQLHGTLPLAHPSLLSKLAHVCSDIIFQTQLCVSAYVCDIVMCQLGQQTQEIQSRDRQLSESAHQMASLRANGSAYVSNTGLCVTLLVGRQEGHPACKK